VVLNNNSLEKIMIGYVTLGTADLVKSAAFYDVLLGTIGAGRFMEEPNYFIAWAKSAGEPSIAVSIPFNKEPASVGNGTMVAVALETAEQVDAFYTKALELGGSCEGKPGFRPEGASSGFYAGYFRDLDGNKLNAFCMVADS
jgi:predicted lactoylglutathione lyase